MTKWQNDIFEWMTNSIKFPFLAAPDNFKNKQTSISNFNSWKNQGIILADLKVHLNYS